MKKIFSITTITVLVLTLLLYGLYLFRTQNNLPKATYEVYAGDKTTNIAQNTPTQIAAHIDEMCDNEKSQGHITFLINHDLYLMSGEGCKPQLLMKEVSDSPTWSPNSKLIAVGCQDDSKLCLVEVEQIVHNTLSANQVTPSSINTFDLPETCSGNRIRSISWSPDGNSIAIVCVAKGTSTIVYILSLQHDGYQRILTDNEILRALWSPVKESLLVSTLKGDIYIFDIEQETSKFLTTGWSPEWSPDGQKIVFVKPNDNGDTNSQMGLALLDLHNQEITWLYVPDRNVEQPSLVLSCGDLRFDCRLAWSPDGRYIAVGARYGFMFNWRIFRLDLVTGELINLTANFDSTKNYEPDWGP